MSRGDRKPRVSSGAPFPARAKMARRVDKHALTVCCEECSRHMFPTSPTSHHTADTKRPPLQTIGYLLLCSDDSSGTSTTITDKSNQYRVLVKTHWISSTVPHADADRSPPQTVGNGPLGSDDSRRPRMTIATHVSTVPTHTHRQ